MRVQGQGRAGRLQLPGQQADLAGGIKCRRLLVRSALTRTCCHASRLGGAVRFSDRCVGQNFWIIQPKVGSGFESPP